MHVFLCVQCDLKDAVHQLFSNHGDNESTKGEKNVTISVSQFPALAAGCILYLSSPSLVCKATKQGRWGEETERFLHEITNEEKQHDYQHKESTPHQEHVHEDVDIHGLEVLLHKLHDHYEPLNHEVSTNDSTIKRL